MPIYEYKCFKCGERFEAFQKMTDSPLTECKFCGGKVEQLISHSSFQLKGSGWYLTDYAKKSQPASDGRSNGSKPVEADSKAGSPKEGSSSAKTEKTEKTSA